eukprot:SAG22_NODE_118_length_19263_cov_16.155813_16_plen_98_part_00
MLPIVDWSATEGNSTGNGYTRVVVTLLADAAAKIPYTTVSLASCGKTPAASCLGVIEPYCDHAPCNVTQHKYHRLNHTKDNMTFSVDVKIADAIILR